VAAEPATPAPASNEDAGSERIVVPESTRAVLASADRSAEDKALDESRRPGELLTYFGIQPGMRVGEIAAGGGYTAELLARTVGDEGKVYAVNSQFLLDRFAQKPWTERLEKPILSNIVRLDRNFDEPFPPEVTGLDVVFCILFYHDLFWMNVDRNKTNRAVFRALKPGGTYAVIDHSSRPGAGASEVESLHRIEERIVREEIESAGFELAGSADFLRNSNDSRDWNPSPRAAGARRGQSDRFVLKFVKP
jgi:predicted methyltransferase